MNIGDMGVPFIYQGEELIYPEYVKDGLVLHYDFSGMTNNDASKDIARDLSGNGNHGTLQNFNFTPESGYDKNKLLFDGVDDQIVKKEFPIDYSNTTDEIVFKFNFIPEVSYQTLLTRQSMWSYGLVTSNNRIRSVLLLVDGTRVSSGVGIQHGDIVHVARAIDYAQRKVSLYLNGNLVKEDYLATELNISGNIMPNLYIGGANTTYNYGDFYSTRIYNRPLTPGEIAHNYAIEKERFGIE